MTKRFGGIALALLAVVTAMTAVANPAAAYVEKWAHLPKNGYARVVDVVDGDTIHVRAADGNKASVRIIGINTPEIYGSVECGGYAAKHRAEQFIKPGMRVKLTYTKYQGNWDRYGRSLRYVTTPSGHDFGALMLRSGLAKTAYDSGHYGTHPRRAWYHWLDAHYHYRACYALRV